MRVIIAGSRTITSEIDVIKAVEASGWHKEITQVICGGADGADRLGKDFAEANGIPIRMFTPNWDKYGKKAGVLRNVQMANHADALIAVWDGKSKGTKHMIEIALIKGLKLFVKTITPRVVAESVPAFDSEYIEGRSSEQR